MRTQAMNHREFLCTLRILEHHTMLDAKWATWVKLLQEDHAQKRKDVNGGLVHCIAELEQQ